MKTPHQTGPRFALAGLIISDWRVARRIQIEAIRDGREYLVAQARNVAIKLRRDAPPSGA